MQQNTAGHLQNMHPSRVAGDYMRLKSARDLRDMLKYGPATEYVWLGIVAS